MLIATSSRGARASCPRVRRRASYNIPAELTAKEEPTTGRFSCPSRTSIGSSFGPTGATRQFLRPELDGLGKNLPKAQFQIDPQIRGPVFGPRPQGNRISDAGKLRGEGLQKRLVCGFSGPATDLLPDFLPDFFPIDGNVGWRGDAQPSAATLNPEYGNRQFALWNHNLLTELATEDEHRFSPRVRPLDEPLLHVAIQKRSYGVGRFRSVNQLTVGQILMVVFLRGLLKRGPRNCTC